MKLNKKLLDHPFYQSWTKGEITHEQLAEYSYSYFELVQEIPNLWLKAVVGLNAVSKESAKIVAEETGHISLWNDFRIKPLNDNYPSMNDVIKKLSEMNPSELLGAIHSFEIQQPEVAKTKKEGLLKHYNIDESKTKYFDEHMNEEEHIAYGKMLSQKFADKSDFEKGFKRGSEIFYYALDRFMKN